MQSELKMRRQLGLVILEMKADLHLVAPQRVGERERNLERILLRLNLVRRNPIGERRVLVCPKIHAHIGEKFYAAENCACRPGSLVRDRDCARPSAGAESNP